VRQYLQFAQRYFENSVGLTSNAAIENRLKPLPRRRWYLNSRTFGGEVPSLAERSVGSPATLAERCLAAVALQQEDIDARLRQIDRGAYASLDAAAMNRCPFAEYRAASGIRTVARRGLGLPVPAKWLQLAQEAKSCCGRH